MRYSLTFQLCFQYICVYLPKGTQTIKPKFDLLHFLIKAQSYFGGERVVMMTSELWDAVGQSERVVAGSSVGAAGDLRQVFWREQGEPVLVDSCTWDGCLYSVTGAWDITCLLGVSSAVSVVA